MPVSSPQATSNARSLLAIASTGVALAAADTYVVVLALTDMMGGVGVGVNDLQQAAPIISGFLLGYVAVLPLIGRLADSVSRHVIMQICLIVFIIGSALTALSSDLTVMVAGRIVQGIGGGGLVPATLALVADMWPREKRGLPLGIVGAIQELGSVLGPVLGALILMVGSWRTIFWVNAVGAAVLSVAFAVVAGTKISQLRQISRRHIVTLLVAGMAMTVTGLALWAPQSLVTDVQLGGPFVRFGDATSVLATPIGVAGLTLVGIWLVLTARAWWPTLRQVDLPGAMLLGTALGTIVLTFASSDPEQEVVGPLGYKLVPIGVIALILYLVVHHRSSNPLVPHGVVRGVTGRSLVVSTLVGVALVAVVVDVPLFARLSGTEQQTAAALILVRFLVALPVGALVGGYAVRRFGDGLVASTGMGLAAITLFFMSRWDAGALDTPGATIELLVCGFGLGLAITPINDAALAGSPHDAHGTASALVVVARSVGMVVGLALLTAIGLRMYYEGVDALPDRTDPKALRATALVQVQAVFAGASLAAGLACVFALSLGIRHDAQRTEHASGLHIG